MAARLVGMDLGAEATVDRVWVSDGTLPEGSADTPAAVLEAKFASARDLPPPGPDHPGGGRSGRLRGRRDDP